MKLVVGISGASGVNLALKFIQKLPSNIDVFVVFSKNAKIVLKKEHKQNLKQHNNITIFKNNNIAASIASGSFGVDKMIIIPTSVNTLAKIACGISDNLITRAASVVLKENKKLILAPREMPFGTIALKNMTKLSKIGVIIAPPIIGYYSNQKTIQDMENFLIGKWFDLLKIKHNLYKKWD